MDIGNEVRVIEVDEPMPQSEIEEIMVEDAATEDSDTYPRVI